MRNLSLNEHSAEALGARVDLEGGHAILAVHSREADTAGVRILGFGACLWAAVAVAQPREFVAAPPDPGRQTRATIGLVGLGAGYAVAIMQDIWMAADLINACKGEMPITAACITAPAPAIGLATLSLVPVIGPAVMGWVLDTGVGPSVKAAPTFIHRVVGFATAAVQLAGVLFLLSALDGAPLGSGVSFQVTPLNGGGFAALSGRF